MSPKLIVPDWKIRSNLKIFFKQHLSESCCAHDLHGKEQILTGLQRYPNGFYAPSPTDSAGSPANGCLLMKASPWRNPFVSFVRQLQYGSVKRPSVDAQLMPTPVVALGPQAPKVDLECVLQMHLGYLGLGTPWFQGHCIKPYIRLCCKKLLVRVKHAHIKLLMPMDCLVVFWVLRPPRDGDFT